MARERNLNNLKTEKEGIQILRESIPNFLVPSKEERIFIYQKLGIDYRKYSRSIDGIILNVKSISDINSKNDIDLIEIKTTKAKNINKLPYGAFFGITENEENLFKSMKNYKLCIVHTLTRDFVLLRFNEYESLIQNKRIQYQVNFKSKE
tara:strand:+ start:101 stop:550 length:450 start_codon:yes stop_codon:yes gene_type:complete